MPQCLILQAVRIYMISTTLLRTKAVQMIPFLSLMTDIMAVVIIHALLLTRLRTAG